MAVCCDLFNHIFANYFVIISSFRWIIIMVIQMNTVSNKQKHQTVKNHLIKMLNLHNSVYFLFESRLHLLIIIINQMPWPSYSEHSFIWVFFFLFYRPVGDKWFEDECRCDLFRKLVSIFNLSEQKKKIIFSWLLPISKGTNSCLPCEIKFCIFT